MSNEYAFPRYRNCLYHEESGMTLRDYFAAKAMQGQFPLTSADRDFLNPDFRKESDGQTVAERVARISYAIADAMLEARE